MTTTRGVWRGAAVALCLALAWCAEMPPYGGPPLFAAHAKDATVYLFGTVHLLMGGGPTMVWTPHGTAVVPWATPRMLAALDASDVLYEEADIADLRLEKAAFARYGLTDGPSLPAQFTPEQWRVLSPLIAACGVGPEHAVRLRPWRADQVLTQCGQLALRGGVPPSTEMQPDRWLRLRAETQGKPVHFLETPDDAVQALALSDSESVTRLRLLAMRLVDDAAGLRKPARPAATPTGALEFEWRLGEFDRFSQDFEQTRAAMPPELAAGLLRDRNRRFADAILGMLHGHETSFVAVGAGHFVGEDGILHLLLAAGVPVERIQ